MNALSSPGFALCQGPVKVGGKARFGAFFLVEGRLQAPVEIAADKVVEGVLGVLILPQ
jgi:hypothetical protein